MSGGSEAVAFNGVTTQQSSSMHLAGGYTADGTAIYKPLVSGGEIGGGGGGGGAVMSHPLPLPPDQGGQQQGGGGGLNMNNSYMGGGGSESVKRKRGRPRKYGTADGNVSMNILASPPPPPAASLTPPVAAGTGVTGTTSSGGSVLTTGVSSKKARGRPPGSTSKKHQLQPLGSVGAGFTPHAITVKAGEDVSSKIMSISQHGSRALCILSANGAISNVTLGQPATSGGTVTYEGRFEILSLSGSFMVLESGGQRSRSGGLSVSLSGPDGRVFGGSVAGPLTAASPLQVIVGSFIADGRKESKSSNQVEPLSIPTSLPSGSPATGASSPHSRGTLSESPGAPGSPLNQSSGACNNHNAQVMSSMPWK